MSTPEELNQELLAKCDELRSNDPSVTRLNLTDYGKIEWEDASHVAEALETNTLLEDLILPLKKEHFCVDGSVPLTYYLSSSPSLRSLTIDGDGSTAYNQSISSILESLSRNKLLTKLTLSKIAFERPSLVKNVLARTRTLTKLEIVDSCAHTSEAYHAFRRGFQKNSTLKKLHWTSTKRSTCLEEVFFGISIHPKLKTLVLDVNLTRASSQALRSCLCTNGTINYLSIRLRSVEKDEYSTLEPVLLGLACNRGVTHFRMNNSTLTRTSCATAWVELLQKNTSMKIFELFGCSIGREDASAIAQGIGGNTSLEKLSLKNLSTSYGPAWQAMLARNYSLKGIILILLTPMSSDEFGYFARGFAHNTSVKSLSLRGGGISSTEANALADALLGNDTLESLGISCYNMAGAEDAAIVGKLWRNHTLKHLTISDSASNHVTWFPTVLPENCTLETIDLSENALELNQCRAICESLRGSSCLRELNLYANNIVFDDHGAQALNDLLENTPLRMMDVGDNQITTQGIAVLADVLRGNSFLKELRLGTCGISDEGLIQLGEALVENSTLEMIQLEDNTFGQDALSRFFQLLPQMDGLKELGLTESDVDSEELYSAVVDGLRENTSLLRITCYDGEIWHEEAPSDIKALIDFYLNLNRNGRKFLEPPLTSRVPAGLWPRVLAKMSSPQDTSLLYYFLQKKAELLVKSVPDEQAHLR
jgi:hypothetical protein